MNSAFFMFNSPLEFSLSTKRFEYFNGIQPGSEKLFCNYTSSMEGCNSTPRDVIITSAVKKTTNLVLFQRTLRTTRSNATLLLFMDQEAIDSIDQDSLDFTKKMNSYIYKIPKPPGEGMKTKNFVAYLIKEFLRDNIFNINRVIVIDLFDTLFQEDPFNTRFPSNKLHLVDENQVNIANRGNKVFMKKTILDFKLDENTGSMLTINGGYCGGPVNLVIGYFTQLLTLLTFLYGDDQGATNILYVTGVFQAKGIPIMEDDYNGKVRHLFFYRPQEPFPNVTGHMNTSIKSAVLHVYYKGSYKFILSVLRMCPRITHNMKHYLTKKTKNIRVYEKALKRLGNETFTCC